MYLLLITVREPDFKEVLLLTVRDRFGSGSQISKKFVINGPGPFWLREPVL